MKIREVIAESINAHGTNDTPDIGLFSFTLFTLSMAGLYVELATEALTQDIQYMSFGGIPNKTGGKGKPISKIKVADLFNVLSRNDISRHQRIFQQSWRFMIWYFDQDLPEKGCDENGEPPAWDDISYISEMWDKYIDIEKERKKTEPDA